MCGIFGFIGCGFDRATLADVATLAGRRGPHACGWTWWDNDGAHIRRYVGSAEENLEALPFAAYVLIGHSRLATSGAHDDLNSAQPIAMSRFRLAHDGDVEEAVALAHNGVVRLNGRAPRCETDCDSEALLRLATADSGPLAGGLKAAIDALEDDAPFALLGADEDGIVASRRKLPLFVRERHSATFFCSVAFEGQHSPRR